MTDVIATPQGGRWDDSMSSAYGLRVGSTAPTFAVLKGDIYGYQFDANDDMHGAIQLPHQTLVNPEIRLHVHFMFNATTTNGHTVIWDCDWMWSTPFGTFTAPAHATATHTISGNEDNKHLLITVLTATLTGAGPSSVIVFRLHRNGGTSTVNPFVLFVDAHFQRGPYGTVTETDYSAG